MNGRDRSSGAAVGLFAGIGGIELGMHASGYETRLLCEIDGGACAVLREHFPEVQQHPDVRTLDELPDAMVLGAGFPCQDLSQAGRTRGISGSESSLVGHVFRLLDRSPVPRWVVIENVPFMLRLDRGEAMRFLTHSFESRGFRWAYRVVDSRAFGLAQRRQRVLLVASRTEDPCDVLFEGDEGKIEDVDDADAIGFYWTEGLRGLGLALNAIPTLKGGSGIGIPSPPAIWIRSERRLVVPAIEDAERLQGFPVGWTRPADDGGRRGLGARWRLLGNAVSVPTAEWLGRRLSNPGLSARPASTELAPASSWPLAAWGQGGRVHQVELSPFPMRVECPDLLNVVRSRQPLSERATAGFLGRARQASLRFPEGFLADVKHHLDQVRSSQVAA